jgi:hypothetical protein
MCGLCNRLRVIDGAATLAAQHNGKVQVIWFCDSDLNCRFSDLFEPLSGQVRFRYYALPSPLERLFKRALHAIMKRTCGRYLLQFETERLAAAGHDFSELARHSKVYLKTWSRFHPSAAPFSIFRPVPRLQATIEQEAATLDDAVGVHIRRTDFTSTINDIATSKFVAQMKCELDESPHTRFFLATDDTAEEKHLEALFPGRILTYRKRTRDRNRREGIEDAVVDLYCLARCRKIIASHKSSFSETAIALSRKEGVVVN